MFLLNSINLKAQQALLLKKNDLTPYAGVLAPSSYIKDLEQKAALAKMYKDTLDKNKDCLPELSGFEPSTSSGFWEGTILGGMVVGLLAVIFKH